jgi:hypothetical protein
MYKKQILEELPELLNIPQLEGIIFHKVEELKLYFQEEIQQYRNLKENFRRTAYGNMEVLNVNNETGKKDQTYHFELHQFLDDPWTATSIEPSPPPGFEIYDIIPESLIEFIGSFVTPLKKTNTLKEFILDSMEGRTFDLNFVKFSERHVLGTIKNSKTPASNITADDVPDPMTHIYNYDKKDTEKGDYKELIYYMQKYPALKQYFLTEFHMKVKPLILENLIDITATLQPVDLF